MEKKRVAHRTRKDVNSMQAVHVVVHVRKGLPGLRDKRTFAVLEQRFRAGKERFGFRLLHFAVISNHVHMIVQVDDRKALARGMQGLSVRMAKGLNRLWGRKGQVFADRYHDTIMTWPGHMRNAVRYVLQSARRHGIRIPRGLPDPFSSAPWFKLWDGRRGRPFSDRPAPITEPSRRS